MKTALSLVVAVAAAGYCFAAPEKDQEGTVSGKVVKSGETVLAVAVKDGKEQAFHVPKVPKDASKEEKSRIEMIRIAATKSLKPGIPVTVQWRAGDKDTKVIEKLSASGSIEGVVVKPREKLILRVKVEGIDGPMTFAARWVKQNRKWVAKISEVKAFAGIPTGARVAVTYELEEHFRVNDLKMIK